VSHWTSNTHHSLARTKFLLVSGNRITSYAKPFVSLIYHYSVVIPHLVSDWNTDIMTTCIPTTTLIKSIKTVIFTSTHWCVTLIPIIFIAWLNIMVCYMCLTYNNNYHRMIVLYSTYWYLNTSKLLL
jgi:hypothetical protein